MGDTVNRGVNIYFNEAELNASLARAQKSAAGLEEKMAGIADKTSPEYLKLQQQLQATTAKIDDLGKRASGQVAPSIRQMEAAASKLRNELKNLPVESDKFIKKAAELKTVEKDLERVKQSTAGVSSELQKTANVSGGVFGGIAGKVSGLGETFSDLGGQVKALWAIIAANPILAVIAAVAAFGQLLTRNAKVADELSFALSGLSKAADSVIDKFVELSIAWGTKILNSANPFKELLQDIGQLIVDNIINRFKGFGELFNAIKTGSLSKLTDAFLQITTGVTNASDKLKDFGKNLQDGYKEGARAARILDDLTALQGEYGEAIAKNNAEIERQKTILADRTKGDEARIAAARRIIALEDANANKMVVLAKKELEAEELLLQGRTKSSEQEKKLSELRAAVIDAASQAESNSRRAQIRLNQLLGNSNEDLLAKYKVFIEGINGLNRELAAGDEGAAAVLIQKTEEKYNKLLADNAEFRTNFETQRKALIIDEKTYNEAIRLNGLAEIEIRKAKAKELEQIDKKNIIADTDAEFNTRLTKTKAYYEQQKALAQESYTSGIISKRTYEELIQDLSSKSIAQQMDVFMLYYANRKALYAGDAKALDALEKEKAAFLNALYADDLKNFEAAQKKKLDAQTRLENSNAISFFAGLVSNNKRELDEINRKLAAKLKAHQDNEAAITQDLADADAARLELQQNNLDKLAAGIKKYGGAALSIANDVVAVFNMADEQELQSAKAKSDEKIAEYKRQLDNDLINKREYDALVEKQNKQQDAKEKQIKKQQFERNKVLQIAEATISTATAAINAYKGLVGLGPAGPFLAAIAAATVAAFGAAKIALIARQQPPSYGKGGLMKGPLHSSPSKGLNVVNNETGKVEAVVEGDEYWTNRKSTKKYLPLLEAINADDTMAMNRWFRNRPAFNMSGTLEAIRYGKGSVTQAEGFKYDDERLRHTIRQVQYESAHYMVNGIVNGIASSSYAQSRKL